MPTVEEELALAKKEIERQKQRRLEERSAYDAKIQEMQESNSTNFGNDAQSGQLAQAITGLKTVMEMQSQTFTQLQMSLRQADQ